LDLQSKLDLLFSENKSKEIPLIAGYQSTEHLHFAIEYIHEYFAKINRISNHLLAGRALLFLARCNVNGSMSTMRSIIESVANEAVLNKVLSVKNSSNEDILYSLSISKQIDTLKWFLIEVIPNDHPSLYSQSSHSDNTVFMHLVKGGHIDLAKQLLAKITDKKLKLQLLNAKSFQGFCDGVEHGEESVLQWAQRRNIVPITKWLKEQIQIAAAQ